jgi:hypothetical protein
MLLLWQRDVVFSSHPKGRCHHTVAPPVALLCVPNMIFLSLVDCGALSVSNFIVPGLSAGNGSDVPFMQNGKTKCRQHITAIIFIAFIVYGFFFKVQTNV